MRLLKITITQVSLTAFKMRIFTKIISFYQPKEFSRFVNSRNVESRYYKILVKSEISFYYIEHANNIIQNNGYSKNIHCQNIFKYAHTQNPCNKKKRKFLQNTQKITTQTTSSHPIWQQSN